MTELNPELIAKAADAIDYRRHDFRVDHDTLRPYCTCDWSAEESYDVAAYDRHLAVLMLEAVAPLIAAQALEDAADELHRLDDGRTGGYYSAGRHIIARLRNRAAKLRGADK